MRTRGPRSPSGFYGWHIVGYATLMVAASAPGQTAAVSVFIDPMIAELGISRSTVSAAYLVGTLSGAFAMPFVGRMLDRFGVRRVMTVIGLVFSAALCALAGVSSVVGLTGGFVAIRMAGQGALGLAATTAVALWFDKRRGTALGVVSAIGASAIALAPVLLEGVVIAQWGWRSAWLAQGVTIALVVLPVAWFGMRDRPADLGQRPDGAPDDGSSGERHAWGLTRAAALRTPFFWVVTAAIATVSLLVTAINFHQISLLGEQGLSATEAAANFIPQTVTNLLATFAAGYLADRVHNRILLVACMACLLGGLVLATVVSPGVLAVLLGLLIGAAGGSVRALEAATLTRYFGTAHIGAIRGTVSAVMVGSTAFGPLAFAGVFELAGSYVPALLVASAMPVTVAIAAIVIRPPHVESRPHEGATPEPCAE
ncbi:Major Facilitator Superfamily protein [Haloechinothrix alba]|uniref:Major Facilitator Superfamily protein n=1 Tax=Haloechinothrix alba TaxID=664784 RepID=A0A238ZA97_9PSEU|nr:MFS transporter [Haloechinothrix alba]SNR80257.1 Major Facilitator Superfamily protein [Haloechinothrix alba]